MSIPRPHFLLFSDAVSEPGSQAEDPSSGSGAWRFVLEAVDGEDKLEVEDEEPHIGGDRLDLLAVVRGLEALDQPSRVTLVTSSRYVARGLRYGLREWRENDWQWERFGQMAPVRNGDLWQRVDRALQYHRVDCRTVGPLRSEREEPSLAEKPTVASRSPRAAAPRGMRQESEGTGNERVRYLRRTAFEKFLWPLASALLRPMAAVSPSPREDSLAAPA